jgi:hypothetical protein
MLEMNLVLGMLARNFELLEIAAPNSAVPEEVLTFTAARSGHRSLVAGGLDGN